MICRVLPAVVGSSFHKWQASAIDEMSHDLTSAAELRALEGFLAGLYAIHKLPDPDIDLSSHMYTMGILSDISGFDTVPVDYVLWDSGNLSKRSLVSQRFINKHKEFFAGLTVEVDDSTIPMADGKSFIRITQNFRLILTVRGLDGNDVKINTTFSVMPDMPQRVDIILSLQDMIFSAPNVLLSLIERAAQHVQLCRGPHEPAATPLSSESTQQHNTTDSSAQQRNTSSSPSRPSRMKLVYMAQQTGAHQPRRVFSPTPHSQLSAIDQIVLRNKGYKLRRPPPRTDVFAISLVDGTIFDESYNDLTPSEADQDVRPTWTQREDVGPEERDSPFPGMFTEPLAFMEKPIGEARAEYLAELAKPPAQPPPPTPFAPTTAAGAAASATTAKPAKRERFNPDLYNLPGFREYMETEAVDVFVPNNWQGIKVPPIDFQFRHDMPDTHRGKARPINPKRADIVKTEFDRLCKYHLVRSKSSIVSPITDADKATAPFVRICGDYRWINKQILLDHEHIPHVQHELAKLKGQKYYIDLDMINSFHQFRLGLKTSDNLSVITPWGSFRPVFMPEGVSPATGVLQGHMREIFKDFEDWAVVIFDNFCIGGDSMEDLFAKLKLFIARCKEFNIFLKLSKCYFGHSSVKFFGYEVDGNGWKIDDERKEAIMAIPFPSGPTTKLKVQRMQSFLGFSLYFKDFVDGYSTKAAPLYDMTAKAFSWSEDTWKLDYRALFEQFKLDMCKSFTLIFPDYSLPWILQPDASNSGIGAILFQVRTLVGDDGKTYTRREPIACISQKFSDPATRWAVIKQEMYAIYRSVEKLSYYLKHKAFQVQTDHSNLVQMEKSSVGIITRWRCFLQSFPMKSIVHIAGKHNVAADYMSRVHECDRDVYTSPDNAKSFLSFVPPGFSHTQLEEGYATVQACTELDGFSADDVQEFLAATFHRADEPQLHSCAAADHPCSNICCAAVGRNTATSSGQFDDAILAGLSEPLVQQSPPAHIDTYTDRVARFDDILRQVHGGPQLHFGALRTWRVLQQQFAGHRIPMAYVRFYIRECPVCQKYRRTLTNDRIPPITRHLKVPGPRSTVGIDGFKMTPPDKHGNSYIHVLVNQFTKHVYLHPSKSQDAEGAANAILTYISLFGRFTRLISDPGSDYVADTVVQLNKYFGIDRAISLVDRHESNGVEPTNRELKRHIQTLVHDKRFSDRWSEPQVLGLITFHINNMRSSESGYSAFDCTFGSLQSDFFQSLGVESASPSMLPTSKFVTEVTKDIAAIQQSSKVFQQNLVNKRATDLSAPRNAWAPGDLVFVDNTAPLHKLQAPRLGPYEVVSHHKNDVMLRDLITSVTKAYHVDRLSLFTGSESDAFDLAMRDRNQHLLDCFLAYRGDVNKRETLEFLISYANDPVPVWRAFDKDLSDTAAYESFCKSLPQLEPLLLTAAQAAAEAVTLRKQRTDATHQQGDIIFVDLRSRAIYEHEWYNSITLDNKNIIPRYSKLRVGGLLPSQRGIAAGTRVDLFDDAFGLVHRVDSHFLRYNGTLRSISDLPTGSEIVSTSFAESHPYDPIDQIKHASMAAADRQLLLAHLRRPLASDTPHFRILSLNVNGIASAQRNGLLNLLKRMDGGPPHVLMLQETRMHTSTEEVLERLFAPLGYRHFQMLPGVPHRQCGVAVFSKTPFLLQTAGATYGVEQGRALAVTVEGVTIVNLYAPIVCGTQQRMLERRIQFDEAILSWLPTLPEPLLIGGDFNLAADTQLDYVPSRKYGYTMEFFTSAVERNLYTSLVAQGYIDVFRSLHPTALAYTTFPKGTWTGLQARIDFFMARPALYSSVTSCTVHSHTPAISDHAGVEISLKRLSSNPVLPFHAWSPTSRSSLHYNKWFRLGSNQQQQTHPPTQPPPSHTTTLLTI